MSTRRENERDTDMSTLTPGVSYHDGLRTLARMIARCYLRQRGQHLQKEAHTDVKLCPEWLDDELSQGSNDESIGIDNEHRPS
jgi:hypothetical protein